MKSLYLVFRIGISIAALGMLAYILTHIEKKDADIVFIVGMTALTFPVGVIVTLAMAVLLGLVLVLTGIELENSIPFYFVVWSIYAIAGYLQWFHVLPSIRRRANGQPRDSAS